MATTNCCQLVSGLELAIDGCVVSINMNSSTEIIKECESEGTTTGVVLVGPTKGSISISAFVSAYVNANGSPLYNDCVTSANISIPWMTRYDCDGANDYTQYINTGQGSASVIGDPPYVTLLKEVVESYPNLTANSSSGPNSVYSLQAQRDGYGLNYTGGPTTLNFNSSVEGDLTLSLSDIIPQNALAGFNIADTTIYLQSFNVNYSPGEIPTATFSYAFSLNTPLIS